LPVAETELAVFDSAGRLASIVTRKAEGVFGPLRNFVAQ
jgi:hypothetical protein